MLDRKVILHHLNQVTIYLPLPINAECQAAKLWVEDQL